MQVGFKMSSAILKTYRRFAPLRIEEISDRQDRRLQKVKGIVFDLDGTLCLPQSYMFKQMRSALGISKGIDILDHCESLPAGEREKAFQKIREIEAEAMIAQVPQPGLLSLIQYLEKREIPKAICTRNFEVPVTHLLQKFLPNSDFAPIVTRNFKPPKPDPAGILHIAETWGFVTRNKSDHVIADASGMIMVGDSLDDLTAGHRAGAATVLLVNSTNNHLKSHEHCDLAIEKLNELIDILEDGFSSKNEGDIISHETR